MRLTSSDSATTYTYLQDVEISNQAEYSISLIFLLTLPSACHDEDVQVPRINFPEIHAYEYGKTSSENPWQAEETSYSADHFADTFS
jgi:hypothetical protein